MAAEPSPSLSPAPGRAAVLALRDQAVVRRVAAVAGRNPVHLVGGVIRDAWLGRATRDLDLVVSGRGEEIARRLAGLLPARFVPLGGEEFASFRLVGKDFVLDLWDRGAMSLVEDLARRDLTVNSIAVALNAEVSDETGDETVGDETVVDPFDGRVDLEGRKLRATTERSFLGDPLRVLRLPRLLAQLPGFEVEPATRDLARRAAPGLRGIAVERIQEELRRLFTEDGTARGFREMTALGLYPELFAGRSPDRSAESESPWARTEAETEAGLGAETAAREMEALPGAAERLVARMAEIGLTPDASSSPASAAGVDPPAAKWASALLQVPRKPADTVLRRLVEVGYLSRRSAQPVRRLLRDPEPPPAGAQGEIERRRALHRLAETWATALAWWGARTEVRGRRRQGEERAREVLELVRREGDRILHPPVLLSGLDVQELLEISPGPRVGKVLEAIRRAQVEGRVRTREEAVAEVRRVGGLEG